MFLYEKVILKNDIFFQSLSKIDKQKYLKMLKHKYLALWLSDKFTNSPIPLLFSLALSLLNLLFCIVFNNIFPLLFFIITFPIMIFIVIVEIIVLSKQKRENKNTIKEFLFNIFMSFWLLNSKVISRANWKFIKKQDIDLYKYLRSDESNHRCYETTHKLANFLKDNDLKILWISVSTPVEKVGHAALFKNNFIYDTNTRRTYSKDIYLQAFNADIYKEFSLTDYSDKNFFSLYYDDFVAWCRSRNVVPYDEND